MPRNYKAGTDANKTMFNLALRTCERVVLSLDNWPGTIYLTKKVSKNMFDEHEDRIWWSFSGYHGSNLFLQIVEPVEEK